MSYEMLQIILTYPDGSTVDVSDLLVPDSYTEKLSLCGADKKSSINTASFVLYYDRSLFLDFTNTEDLIGVFISNEEEDLFNGYIDPVGTIGIVGVDEVSSIPIEAVDQLSLLSAQIPDDLSYPPSLGDEPWPIYDPEDLTHSILFDLLVRAGLHEQISIDSLPILDTILHYSIEADSLTWKEAIDTILFERRLVITTQGTNTIWRPWSEDNPAAICELTEKELLSNPPVSIGNTYNKFNGDSVVWAKAKFIEDTRLWEGSLPIGNTDVYPGEPIAAGDYWPEDSDAREIYQDFQTNWLDIPYLQGETRFKNDDLSLLATGGWYITDAKDEEIIVDLAEYSMKRARIRYTNSGEEAKKLYYSRIYGSALIRNEKAEAITPATSNNPESYTSITIFDSDTGDALSRALYNERRYGKVNVSFGSAETFLPGDVIKIIHKSEDIEILVRIIGRTVTRGSDKTFSYSAVGCSIINTLDIRRRGSLGSSLKRPPVVPKYQYASTAEGPWHSPSIEGDFFYRISLDGGITWTDAVQFRGEAGAPAPRYLGKLLEVPIDPVVDDFFLYAGSSSPFVFGHIYKWNGSSWVETIESYYLSAVSVDAQKLAYDTGITVYAAVVFAYYLNARNLTVGPGDGITSGSGLLFEVKGGEPEETPAIPPVIRAMFGDKKVWRIDPSSGDFEIGDYASGKGAIYKGSTGEYYGKFSEIRNILPFQFLDSLDSLHPMETEFFIPSSTARIVSVKINAKGSKYRAYSTALAVDEWLGRSTGNTTPSHGLTVDSFADTSDAGSHTHSYNAPSGSTSNVNDHAHSVGTNWNTASTGSTSAGGDYHSHSYYPPPNSSGNAGGHGHTVGTSPSNTGNNGSHSHRYNAVTAITGGSHSHSFSIDHSHNLAFGIYEGSTPTDVSLYIDNGSGYGSAISLGSNAILASDLDITFYLSGNGWKSLKFTSSRMGRINVQIIVEVDITA